MNKVDPAGGRVLVTGAGGFLGSWILARLVKGEGKKAAGAIIATDRQHSPTRLHQLGVDDQRAIEWRDLDITDTKAVDDLIGALRPACVIHLAALQIPGCRAQPALGARVNVLGHVNLFEAARRHGVSKVIYTSSIAAKPRGPAHAPANLYGVFKKCDEEISRLYWEDSGMASLGLRPHIVYGVGRDDGETSAITRAIQAAAEGRPYQMPFDTRSCFQYAGEVAEIVARCLDSTWEGAVVSDLTVDIESTDDLLSAIFEVAPDARITPSNNQRPSPMDGLDNAPLRAIIGRWPRTSLRTGVARTFEMFRAQSAAPRAEKTTTKP